MDYLDYFGPSAKAVLDRARSLADLHGHGEIEPEHVLLAIVQSPESKAGNLLRSFCQDLGPLELRLKSLLARNKARDVPSGRPSFSRRTTLLMGQAFKEKTRSGSGEISTVHLLLAMDFERFSELSKVLEDLEISSDLIRMWLTSPGWNNGIEDSVIDHGKTNSLAKQFRQPVAHYGPALSLIFLTAESRTAFAIGQALSERLSLTPGRVLPEEIISAVLSNAIKESDPLVDDLESIGIDSKWCYLRLKTYTQRQALKAGQKDADKSEPYTWKKLGDILILLGSITPDQLDQALLVQKERGKRLGETLVDLGYCSGEAVAKGLALQLGIEFFNPETAGFDGNALKCMSKSDAARLRALPYLLVDENELLVIVSDPHNKEILREIEEVTGKAVIPIIGTEGDIAEMIANLEGLKIRSKEEWELTTQKAFSAAAKGSHEELDLRWPFVRFWTKAMDLAVQSGSPDVTSSILFSAFLSSDSEVSGQIRRKFSVKAEDIQQLAQGAANDEIV